jgi:hypothetical protein
LNVTIREYEAETDALEAGLLEQPLYVKLQAPRPSYR